jgi:uncharacterized protein YjbJ (UPF0337 family)
MADSAKDIKGKVKERAGRATGDERLEREGQVEQGGEKVKQGVDKAVDKTKDLLSGDERR